MNPQFNKYIADYALVDPQFAANVAKIIAHTALKVALKAALEAVSAITED